MTKLNSSKVIFTLLAIFFVTACNSGPSEHITLSDRFDGLFSTRTQRTEPLIVTLRLENSALLETATRENGQLQVDAKLVQAIEKEQTALIQKLSALSPEVRILQRFRLVANALTIVAPENLFEKIKSFPNITLLEKATPFARPVLMDDSLDNVPRVGERTSVKFMGAEAAYAQNIRGQGMKIGIIDTGIDYTHKMFLGEGTVEAYKKVDPNYAPSFFPNKKVVGGIDLVGTAFNSSSPDLTKRLPVPDNNPLDEARHGTHVAGTVAGIGDGEHTYDGVAPEAELYAIKVFGAEGTTSDYIVVAALEYAADPHQDLSFRDQLDVVNLSLGSGYGNPHILYNMAIKNLVRGGTLVVASAGNSGDRSYIVGSPGISDDAISVASSLDDTSQNIEFPTLAVHIAGEQLDVEFVEGAITKSLSKFNDLRGSVIALGFADKDFTAEEKQHIQGKVALIDRGLVDFATKIRRAQESGALAVIVANNVEGPAIAMGGDGSFDIPGVMITLKDSNNIKEALQNNEVIVDLKSPIMTQKPWLVDTISSFSSRGPRSDDGKIKPEIAAPGSNILSALAGGGDKGLAISGTSMASPHIAGVMALLKQKFPELNPAELKSVLLGHGKVISDERKNQYTVSRQGAGRVQIAASLQAQVVSSPATLSFGITDIEKQKTLSQELVLKNIGSKKLTLTPEWVGSAGLVFSIPTVTLEPGASKKITMKVTAQASRMKGAQDELDGFLLFKNGTEVALQMPALLVARQISQIKAGPVTIHSTSAADSAGSLAEVELRNEGVNPGKAYLFNLLGTSERKPFKDTQTQNRNCDLQSAGYRVITKDNKPVLQVAMKLYEGTTTWNTCEVNVQIDANHDDLPDQELAGLPMSSLPGLTGSDFVSLLLDGNKAREIRKAYEVAFETKENYSSAVLDMRPMQIFDNATLAIIEAEMSQLAKAPTGELALKISTTHQDGGVVEYDDYLTEHLTQWHKISVAEMGQAYSQLPDELELKGGESQTLALTKGYGSGMLILYAPENRGVRDILLEDSQSQVVPEVYLGE